MTRIGQPATTRDGRRVLIYGYCRECGTRINPFGPDNNERLCPDCFELAGIENEHTDGHHANGCPSDCPSK